MTELYPPDAQLNQLSGSSDPQQEVLYIPTGQSPYHTSFYKMLYRLLDVSRRAGDLRVYKDGDLTFGVRSGLFMDGPTVRSFAGAAGEALSNNATNWIYLTTDGTLTVSTDSLPDPLTTPHLPLASIVVAAGQYAHEDVTDLRGRVLYRPAGAVPRQYLQAETLMVAVPLTTMRKGSEGALSSLLGPSAEGSDLGLISTGFGQAVSAPRLISSSLTAGGTLTQKARFLARLPVGVQAGEPITCFVKARCDVCEVGATLSLAVFELDGAGGYAGAPTNLCTSPARALTADYSTAEFTLSAPSDGSCVLDALLTLAMDDTDGEGDAKQAHVASVTLQLVIKG